MKVAIIGYGVVGATVAYYLGKSNEHEVHVFDLDTYQATRAAVGIVCPWVSQRRNKKWYDIANQGAETLVDLVRELGCETVLRRTGTLVFHNNLQKLYEIALKNTQTSNIMGIPRLLEDTEVSNMLPNELNIQKPAIFIPGGMQVDGEMLVQSLQRNSNIVMHSEWATLSGKNVNGIEFDCICACAGGFLQDLFPSYSVKTKMQKGQLIELDRETDASKYPVIMPQGEVDILAKNNAFVIGASHENLFSTLDEDPRISIELLQMGSEFFNEPIVSDDIKEVRVGVRSVSHDYMPFIEIVDENIYAIGGLGSSGLTTGPILAQSLVSMILEDKPSRWISRETYFIAKEKFKEL